MPIEVRQLLIRSTVEPPQEPRAAEASTPRTLEQLRRDILAECRAMLDERLQQIRER